MTAAPESPNKSEPKRPNRGGWGQSRAVCGRRWAGQPRRGCHHVPRRRDRGKLGGGRAIRGAGGAGGACDQPAGKLARGDRLGCEGRGYGKRCRPTADEGAAGPQRRSSPGVMAAAGTAHRHQGPAQRAIAHQGSRVARDSADRRFGDAGHMSVAGSKSRFAATTGQARGLCDRQRRLGSDQHEAGRRVRAGG